jgi:maltose O-acetyltransferase
MAFKSLNQFLTLRQKVTGARKRWLRFRFGVDLHPSVIISLSTRFVARERGSITVGPETLIAFKTLVMSYDARTRSERPVRIGRRCFIGGGSTVLPGVTIGDESIVAAGAVVDSDVPARCVVAGNPAAVIGSGIQVGPYGHLIDKERTGS